MDLQGVELERHIGPAQKGDPLAMAALLRGLAPWVGRICGSIALDDGDDAMQETMIRVLKGIRSLREPAALRGWVRRIAVREAIKLAQARRDPLLLDWLPERAAGDATEVADIADVLRRLTPEQRAILVLRDLEGFSEAEAATLLGVERGTVKSRLHRARQAFRRRWSG
jgi:RNA polymerase sigma factor (sigma-70 family)